MAATSSTSSRMQTCDHFIMTMTGTIAARQLAGRWRPGYTADCVTRSAEELGARTVALGTPYPASIHAGCPEFLDRMGLPVVAMRPGHSQDDRRAEGDARDVLRLGSG